MMKLEARCARWLRALGLKISGYRGGGVTSGF